MSPLKASASTVHTETWKGCTSTLKMLSEPMAWLRLDTQGVVFPLHCTPFIWWLSEAYQVSEREITLKITPIPSGDWILSRTSLKKDCPSPLKELLVRNRHAFQSRLARFQNAAEVGKVNPNCLPISSIIDKVCVPWLTSKLQSQRVFHRCQEAIKLPLTRQWSSPPDISTDLKFTSECDIHTWVLIKIW